MSYCRKCGDETCKHMVREVPPQLRIVASEKQEKAARDAYITWERERQGAVH